MDFRSFVFGTLFGIAAIVVTFSFLSALAGVKWQPVAVNVDR